jgi:two-component system, NarL family, sensor kinase
LLRSDPDAAGHLLDQARTEIQSAVADVRRLVYELRPPALDELGLVGALREQAGRLSTAGGRVANGPRIEIDAAGELDALPAAVEVAAYRIALEGMTNVARHAQATSCTIEIALDGALALSIIDDGAGLPEGCRAGVGMASMHERAEELGGTCEIAGTGDGGTRVRARLPLGVP